MRDPAKLVRVAHTALAVSGATTSGSLDEATRTRLAHTWATLMAELDSAVSEDAMAELRRLLPPTNEPVPSEGDLRLTEAQIVGWLNGLMMGETMSTWMAGVAGEQHLARSLASTLAQHAPHAAGQFQEELDLDSINFLDFVHDRTGVDIPERDYPQVATLEGCLRYLRANLAA